MLETKQQPLAPVSVFRKRVLKSIMKGMFVLLICLMIGVAGYHYTADIPWIDALHNAAMILSGMGPVVEIKSVSGKLFSTFYALFSGVIFITNIGIILAPAIHRFLHQMHVQSSSKD